MRPLDVLRFAADALRGARTRSALMLLAMAIGVAAVVVLTSLGEAARRYVTGEFASLGTNLLIVLPGRSETTGTAPPMIAETPRDLTVDDALALERSRHVRLVAPVGLGSASVSWGGRRRDAVVLGSTAALEQVRHLEVAQGRFLPHGDVRHPAPVCVLGATLRRELFGPRSALGEWVRIGEWRFRVVGVLGARGESLGLSTDEAIYIPVAAAQSLFDTESLFRILVEGQTRAALPEAKRDIENILRARHEGEEDVTVITQDAVLATFDRILRALTLTVAGIAGISLVVAGVLIMNVMLIAVSQRTAEIGLLKALGAPRQRVLRLFLTEAALLSLAGATAGIAIGFAGDWVIGRLYPALPLGAPAWAVVAAALVALGTGLLFGVLPARRAAGLDPVKALAKR